MVARQLPKLKTRVRFPSPAPEIEPTKVSVIFLGRGDGREPGKEGSKPSRFHKCNVVKSLRVARRHKVLRDSLRPHQICYYMLFYLTFRIFRVIITLQIPKIAISTHPDAACIGTSSGEFSLLTAVFFVGKSHKKQKRI